MFCTIKEVRDSRIYVSGYGSDELFIFNISPKTYILDAMSGNTLTTPLQVGEGIAVYSSNQSTDSLPPQSNATVIFANIPADAGFPTYGIIETISSIENGVSIKLTNSKNPITLLNDTPLSIMNDETPIKVNTLKPNDPIIVWFNYHEFSPVATPPTVFKAVLAAPFIIDNPHTYPPLSIKCDACGHVFTATEGIPLEYIKYEGKTFVIH
ncbi:MAG: hypothetical protein ACRCSG_00670 [Cellulosilyticaceae bacterium]